MMGKVLVAYVLIYNINYRPYKNLNRLRCLDTTE